MSSGKSGTGPKPRHPGAGWVLFEVSPAIYKHLQTLVHKSGLGESPDEVAKTLFVREVQQSMKEPARDQAHPDTWYTDDRSAPDAEEENA